MKTTSYTALGFVTLALCSAAGPAAAEHRPDLLGGVTVITGEAKDGRKITAVPYYAWDHRTPGEMIVWVAQDGKAAKPDVDDPAWKEKLYRVWLPSKQ
jgi:DUF1680 family protein